MIKKKQLWMTFSLLFLLLVCSSLSIQAQEGMNIVVNGQSINDWPRVIENEIYLPVRALGESLGYTLFWEKEKGQVWLKKEGQEIKITPATKEVKVNDTTIELNLPIYLLENKTYVPLTFFSQALKREVYRNNAAIIINDQRLFNTITPREIYEHNKNAIFKIIALDQEGNPFQSGSGFLIEGKIVTNYHVIHSASMLKVIFDDNSSVIVTDVLAYDQDRDFAILKLPGLNSPMDVELGKSAEVITGEEVIAIGSPLGFTNTVTDGLISGKKTIGSQSYFLISVPVSPGNSGGPLFDSNGKVIGLVTAKLIGGENLNLALPIDQIKPLLTKELTSQTLTEITRKTEGESQSIDGFTAYLQRKYGTLSYDKYVIHLSNIELEVINSRVIGATFILDSASYADWLAVKSLNSDVLSKWMMDIKKETKERYPDFSYLGMVIYVKPVDQYPFFSITIPVYSLADVAGIEFEKWC